MTLLPAGAWLEAHLHPASRDIGFLRPGQRVLIRYDAFPHQKFGRYEGVVRTVSHAPTGPTEAAEAGSADATYRITVELTRQTATAYGEQMPLRPDMTLAADVLIEARRLWQWVLDPLYALQGERRA